MRYGFVVPFTTEHEFVELARLGEERGWDAVLTWEALFGTDAWVLLGATALATERIRLGTLLTPASRYRPWDLASDVGTVDRLSGGRAFLSVGLGALHPGWTAFEADEGRGARARKLDECLEVYAGLTRGDDLGTRVSSIARSPTTSPSRRRRRSDRTRPCGWSVPPPRAVGGSAPWNGRHAGRA